MDYDGSTFGPILHHLRPRKASLNPTWLTGVMVSVLVGLASEPIANGFLLIKLSNEKIHT